MNIYIMGGQEEAEEEKWAGRTMEKIMAENFPNLIKDININIHKAQQTTSNMN